MFTWYFLATSVINVLVNVKNKIVNSMTDLPFVSALKKRLILKYNRNYSDQI